jgi:hypothetical protein
VPSHQAVVIVPTMNPASDSARNETIRDQRNASKATETQVPPLSAFRETPLSDDEEVQVQRIVNATEARDWHALRSLAALPGGFIDDEARRIVCTCKQRFCYLPRIAVLIEGM